MSVPKFIFKCLVSSNKDFKFQNDNIPFKHIDYSDKNVGEKELGIFK